MYHTKLIIAKNQQKKLTRKLTGARSLNYFIESSPGMYLIHIFSESPQLPVELNKYTILSCETDDDCKWRYKWAENFTGHELTGDIYVTVAGKPLPAPSYRHVIMIDPRDAFGDGHHPTTRLCALLLQEHIAQFADASNLSMLDAGTGSGLLSIIAYILGLRNIELFDIDENSVFMAERNLQLNGISGINPTAGDIYTRVLKSNYSIITANLLTAIIEDNFERLKCALADDGVLIVSGISTKWTYLLKRLIKRNKMVIVKHKKLEGWNGFLLKKRSD